jgi:ATPase subunit of ABC transporter with duplicated ATPase domains
MSLMSLKDLYLTRGLVLFKDLSFSVAKGDRLGLVAANGKGKSSLLRIMAGMDDSTSGTLTSTRGLVVAFAPQDPPVDLLPLSFHTAVRTALAPEIAETECWRVDILLDDLAVDQPTRNRLVCDLSGGWQRTMLLARAAVIEPDLLLLDEPTNHLDLGRIGVLQRFLAGLPRDCAVMAASHDRAFLDDTSTRTLFLRAESSEDFALPYSRALAALRDRDTARGRQFENDMRKVRSLRQQAAKLKNIGVNSGSDLLVVKTKQLSDRADKLEDSAKPLVAERSAGTIRLTNSGTHAKALVTFKDAVITTPDQRVLFRTGKLWIENGDRVALLGANGTVKTRLVARLRAAIQGEDADLRHAASLRLGYSDQLLAHLDDFASPWEAVKASSDLADQLARSLLSGAGIAIDTQTAAVARLSGGQKARLAMLLLRLGRPNFYLLDEPTNHLDIEGQDMLENELIEHGTACLLVSHDRAFVRAVATRIWVIEGGRLTEVDAPDPVFDRLLHA